MLLAAGKIAGNCHAESSGERSSSMPGTVAIMLAFRAKP